MNRPGTSGPSLLGPGKRMTDWGRLRTAQVSSVARPRTEGELDAVVREAAQHGRKLSIRGVGHSAGGQSICDGGILLDLRELKRVHEVDPEKGTMRVQGGATWTDVMAALEPHGLSMTTTQEFKHFSVGGSVAANVHGKTVDYGPLIEAIDSFRLLGPDGQIRQVSRDENAELFPLVIGGYGLFGVLLDVTFRVVVDRVVEKTEVVLMDVEPLCASYAQRVKRDPQSTPLCYGFLDAACRRGYYVTYTYAEPAREGEALKRDEPNVFLFEALVRLQRWSRRIRRRGLDIMWATSARPERTLRSRRLLLWDQPPRAFEEMFLQKYFVPLEGFAEFLRRAGRIFERYRDELPLLTNHFRYVPPNDEAVLSFAPGPSMCLIPCYLARKGSEAWWAKLREANAEILDAAIDLGGSYYLTFDGIASPAQLRRAYPRWDRFVEAKRVHDPEGLFTSLFYEQYARAAG